MATANYVRDGNAIDYTPPSDVAAGDVVVQNNLIGVAKQPIAANQLGSLGIVGVFDFPKATGSGQSIDAGVNVYWDATAQQAVTTPGSGDQLIGKAVADATESDTTVLARLNP